MNVLIIHNTYQQPGGEDVVVAQEGELLEQHGHTTTLYVRSNHEIDALSFPQRLGLVKRMVSAKDSKLAVRALIRHRKPDIVHVHNTFAMVSPAVYAVCQDADIPVVQTLHNYRFLCPASTFFRDRQFCEECVNHNLLRSVQHACYRDSRMMSGAVALMLKAHRLQGTWNKGIDSYIAISNFVKDKFVESGFPRERVHVKPNFVGTDPGERIRPGDYALFVGRLSAEKGVSTLLNAWQRLPSAVPLIITGDGPMRHVLEAEATRIGLDHVRFTGQLGRNEVYDGMKNAAFLIVPSIWPEPFGLIVAEAFACGTPVLASTAGALGDMVDDQVTGLQFAPGDADELAKKVAWAWKHLPELAAMGKAARRVYEDRYNSRANYRLLMNIYTSATRTHGGLHNTPGPVLKMYNPRLPLEQEA
jgi:glycosyltransferase involved in cell wall biosynthesis